MFKPCPYCGILFSGRHGSEKRREIRIRNEIPFVFSYNGRLFEASTINISQSGLSIKIFGRSPCPVGDIADLNVNGSMMRVQVTWMSNGPETFAAVVGLKILDGGMNLI